MMHRLRGRAEVARQAHNLEAVGSIPTPATNDFLGLSVTDGLFFASVLRSCDNLLIHSPYCIFVFLFGVIFSVLTPVSNRNRKQIVSKS